MVMLFLFLIQMAGASKEILVESPFYLRARLHDSRTASVQFEIAGETDHRTCQFYKFTVRRNREPTYSMPEQNLTYWRNSLELKHLDAGNYRVCAVICSENLRQAKFHYEKYVQKNRAKPIKACVTFQALRPHLLVLTLYILVFIFLIVSHIIYSLRKRQFQARMKMALIEVENSLQKWRSNPTPAVSTEHAQSSHIFQSLITLPTCPIEHTPLTPPAEQPNSDEHQPIIFHLEISNEP